MPLFREWIIQISNNRDETRSAEGSINLENTSTAASLDGGRHPGNSVASSIASRLGLPRPSRVEVPEVVVSQHTSPAEMLEDEEEKAQRDLMVQKVQEFLILGPTIPIKDKLFTASLIFLTMIGILVLFWYQNFGPGFTAFERKPGTKLDEIDDFSLL